MVQYSNSSAGLQATKREASKLGKPFLLNPTAKELKAWLATNNIKTLNVAGNRGSKLTTEQAAQVRDVLTNALKVSNNSKALENAKPNVAINVNANPAEKSVVNIAELKGLLVQDAMFSYEGEAQMKRFDEISKMTDEQLVEEALKKKLKC
jgi:hypothetical protein